MVHSCCVVGCTNRQNKSTGVTLHRIPNYPESRRDAWIRAIGRVDFQTKKHWNPTSSSRVCSCHFLEGKPSEDATHPDFIPSQNMGRYSSQSTPKSLQRHGRAKKRKLLDDIVQEGANADTSGQDEESAAEALIHLSETAPEVQRQDMHTQTDESALSSMELLDRNICAESKRRKHAESKTLMLQKKINSLKLTFESLSNVQILFYTGISKPLFLWVFNTIRPVVKFCSKAQSLTQHDHLLLILVKLRLGLLNRDISYRFSLSESVVSRILNTWTPAVARTLKPLIKWPEREVVRSQIPASFKPYFNKVVSIIDCFEIFIERPYNLTTRAKTWSNYKHNNTVKYLISVTPAGAVNFISEGWGGRVSDKEITIESGYMEKLIHGDEVLADRGFLVSEEMACRGIVLRLPSFARSKKQLSSREVEMSRRITRSRIHVERVIGRMRKFCILQNTIPISQVTLLDDMILIIAALHNLCPSIVKQ